MGLQSFCARLFSLPIFAVSEPRGLHFHNNKWRRTAFQDDYLIIIVKLAPTIIRRPRISPQNNLTNFASPAYIRRSLCTDGSDGSAAIAPEAAACECFWGGKMTRPVFTVYTSSVSTCSVRMFIHSGFTTTVGVYLIRVNDPLGTARHTGGYVTALTVAAGLGFRTSFSVCVKLRLNICPKNQSWHLFRTFCRFKNNCFNNTANKKWIRSFLFINWQSITYLCRSH